MRTALFNPASDDMRNPMEMVFHQHIAMKRKAEATLRFRQSIQKMEIVRLFREKIAPFRPATHYMVNAVLDIYAHRSSHGGNKSKPLPTVNI